MVPLLGEALTGAEYGLIGVVVLALLSGMTWLMRHFVVVTLPEVIRGLVKELKEARNEYHAMATEERQTCERRHVENMAVQERHAEAIEKTAVALDHLTRMEESHHAVMDHIAGITRQQATPQGQQI